MQTITKKVSFIFVIVVMLATCQSAFAMQHTAAGSPVAARPVFVHAGQNLGAISASIVKAMGVICVYVEACKQQKKEHQNSRAMDTALFCAMNKISKNLLLMFKTAKIRVDIETWQKAGEKLNEIVLMQAVSDLRNALAALYYCNEGSHTYNKSMITDLMSLCQVNVKKLIASKENVAKCFAPRLDACLPKFSIPPIMLPSACKTAASLVSTDNSIDHKSQGE